jgi:hypothetical protein
MNTKKLVENYLKTEPRARERANRYKTIANLLMPRYGLDLEDKALKDKIVGLLGDAESVNRAIRQAQEHDETLRGNDYGEKERLEQEKQVSLGYVAGFQQDIKKLSTLNIWKQK